MRHGKAKLMAAVMSMTLSLLMLTSASFAWFTISTAPEISKLDTSVVTNENLEICLAGWDDEPGGLVPAIPAAAAVGDSGDAYTWGNLIALDKDGNDGTDGDYASFVSSGGTVLRPAELRAYKTDTHAYAPAEAGETGYFYYPTYGADGRAESLQNLTFELQGGVSIIERRDYRMGFGTLRDTAASGGKVYAYYVDFWLRSNVEGDVMLASPTDALNRGDSDSASGSGTVFTAKDLTPASETLAENVRIAFRVLGIEKDGTFVSAPQNAPEETQQAAVQAVAVDSRYTPGYKDETEKMIPGENVFSGKVTTLAANQGTLIRMYVYLDGAGVTNAAASTDDYTVEGSLSVQFKLVDDEGEQIVTADMAMQVDEDDRTENAPHAQTAP